MTYLLDTHTLIWAITDDQKLLRHLKDEIANLDNDVYVSIASLWEIGIKTSLGKLEFHRDPFDRLLIAQSIIENLTIITKDEKFGLYSVKLKWN
jgi:PIN domain nuclease of toxin-antitoxin system